MPEAPSGNRNLYTLSKNNSIGTNHISEFSQNISTGEISFKVSGADPYFGAITNKGDAFSSFRGVKIPVKTGQGIAVYLTNELFVKNFVSYFGSDDIAVKNYKGYQNNKFVIPASELQDVSYVTFRFGIKENTQPVGSAHLTKVKVEYGNEYTDWSPAPEDLGWSMATLVPTQQQRYLWKFEYIYYSDGSFEVTQPVNLSIAGSDGAQGIPGPKGEDGKIPYIHFAYADDNKGTNFSLTDNNQQYQGYYSDYTQTDSTDPTKYKWVDRLANVQVGGRNLFLNSKFNFELTKQYSTYYMDASQSQTQGQLAPSIDKNTTFKGANTLKIVSTFNGTRNNQKITFRTGGDDRTGAVDEMKNQSVMMSFWAKSTVANTTMSWRTGFRSPTRELSIGTDWAYYSFQLISPENSNATNEAILHIWTAATVWVAFPKVERGTISTDYSEADEDTQEQIDSKADQALTQDQLNALAEKNNLIKAEMEAKATIDTVNQWITAYQNYVNANDADKARSEQALKDASERILGIRYEVDNLKVVWDAIDTYMSFQNEGLVIGKKDGSAYAKFSDDRISLFSGSSEVMYISQGTLNIANGIFTKTIQIGRFRFETHPADADMLVVRFVGG